MKLCWLPLAASILAVVAASTVEFRRTRLSPVTRIVDLLKGIANKVDEEQEKEESHFKDFKCWATSVISTKEASNQKASDRISALEAHIADIDAGRVEFTSERKDLENELAGLNSDLEKATAIRTAENADFVAATEEMQQAIAALDSALEVLEAATDGSSNSLVAVRSAVGHGSEASGSAGVQALSRAVELGQRFLGSSDARFLRRLLTGEVPTWDWKKLNRKAEFKMSYKARSGKIQKVLTQLSKTFRNSLKEAKAREASAVKEYEMLAENKRNQKSSAEKSLDAMLVEGGARGLSKSEAETEVADLRTQIQNDEQSIAQTETDLKTKEDEFKLRKQTRQDELAAISKAVSILSNDDAKDLFKRSLASQGTSFLQLWRSRSAGEARRAGEAAAEALQSAAAAAGDTRLKSLARQLAKASARGNFDAVVAAIDTMLGVLREEEKTDLATKEQCETTRASDAKAAQVAARDFDDKADAISQLQGEIKILREQIKESKVQIEEEEATQAKATEIRKQENAAFISSKKDDEDAVKVVQQAVAVLQEFYQSQAQSLVQRRGGRQEPSDAMSGPGQAPPPPPATWESPYAGSQEENQGIIAILSLLEEDLNKDIQASEAAESSAVAAYHKMMDESTRLVSGLRTTIANLEGDVSGKEEDVASKEMEKASSKEELDAILKRIKDAEPGCDFITVNFAVRSKNRQLEVDGLEKAKAILKAGKIS
mmetsp:Transcript_47450/g.103130  ORF Transcript_47450/g.103130 Transcript_47450/m.103130 type:complete len:717 (-) Transcript_47450:136-2286(-)